MSAFIEPVRRVDTRAFGRASHHYVDGNGTKIPGVTTLLGAGVPKPALVGWAGNVTAEYAVDHWAELADMKPSERLTILKKCRYEVRDAAANRGTEVHSLAERLVKGVEVDVPDELAGHVESYVKFLDAFDVEPVMVETTVYNLTIGYAGQLDLGARLKGFDGLSLCDVKTSKGVYGETGLQVAAYRYAEKYLDDDGVAQPMPEFAHTFVIHVRADGYDLLPIQANESALLNFRYAAAVARAAEAMKDYVGAAVSAPPQEALL